MAPKIYTSSFSAVPVHDRSLFTHLFSTSKNPSDIGGLPGSSPAFIDALTGTTITRAQLKTLAFSFGYGIRQHKITNAKRGDTILIYSQNSLAWPVVLYGSGKLLYY